MTIPKQSQKTIIIIGGPTGIGKSKLSMHLAEQLDCPIISADSRQVYQEINIGTAKPSTEELSRVKHYCVNTTPLTEVYSAGKFEVDADIAIAEAHLKSDYVIVCGGTGLYINALLNGLDEFPDITDTARALVAKIEEKSGIEGLVEELQRVDPVSATSLDLHNTRRIGRALEVYHSSEIPYSKWKAKKTEKVHNYRILSYWLNTDRQRLYDKINKRVHTMLDAGWIAEVEGLVHHRSQRALDTVGYKEIFKYLDGDMDSNTLVNEIQKQTRRYAKRQITWFGNQYDGTCLTYELSSLELESVIMKDLNQ